MKFTIFDTDWFSTESMNTKTWLTRSDVITWAICTIFLMMGSALVSGACLYSHGVTEGIRSTTRAY